MIIGKVTWVMIIARNFRNLIILLSDYFDFVILTTVFSILEFISHLWFKFFIFTQIQVYFPTL